MTENTLTTTSSLPKELEKKLDCRLVHSTIPVLVTYEIETDGRKTHAVKIIYKCKEGCDG